jgi:YD repeat-containing protein
MSTSWAEVQTATYPVYLDPTVVDFPAGGGSAHDTHATDGHPNKNFATYCRPDSPYHCEWTIGRWPGYSYHSEAFIKFTGVATALSSVEIQKAELRFFPYWQYFHYQWRPSWVERVTQSWSATTLTWNNRPATVDDLEVGYLESHEGKWASLDVTDHYQRVVNGTLPEHGFKIHATGTPKGNWKRVISREQSSGSMADKKPILRITWSPFGAAVPAHPIGGGPSGSRTLSWSHHQSAVQSAYQIQLSASTSFTTPLADSGEQSGAAGSWAIPSGVGLTEGTTYYWRVRAKWGTNTAWSAWSATASFVHRPAINLGLQDHNSFENFDLGNGDSVSVNVANGNLVLSAPLVSLPYRGGSLSLGLTYNSHESANVGVGPGWRLSAMRRLTELATGDVVYVAADGSRHAFTKNGTSYTRPPSLYATLTKGASSWTLTWPDLSVDTFVISGSEGLLVRSADRFGNGIDFTYTPGTNRLHRATDAAGRYVEFSWDTAASPARLSSFTDWAYVSGGEVQAAETGSRRQYRFFYEASGNLIGWANLKNTSGACPTSAEHRTCLAYTGGLLSAITKRQLPAAIASGSITTGSARDVTTAVAYAGSMVTEVRDPEQGTPGSGTTFNWTGAGKLRVVRPGSPASTTTYGQLGATTEPLGRVESVWRRLGSAEIEQRTAWHAEFPAEPASVTDNHGAQLNTPARTVTYTYVAGSLGLLATTAEPLTGSTTRTTTYTYNANNDVTQVVTASGSSSTTTRYCYAASGCATTGSALTMRARIENYQGTGAKGGANGHEANVTTEYLYDGLGQLTRETRFNYAPGGALLDQRAIGYEYDALGNLTREIVNYADGAVTGGSDVTPDVTTNARTDLTTVHTYDTAGNRISSADPRRAIGLAICAGTIRANDFVTRSAYDASNLRIRETTGTTLRFSPCSTLPADGRTATYAYDAQGRLRQATDFGGLTTASVYDRAGRVLETLEDPPGSGTSELAVKTSVMTYDAGGRLLTAKDRRQLASSALGYTEYEYDALGRQTSVTEAKGAGTGIEVTTASTYDALDRQTWLIYGGLATTYRYDLGGRVTEVDDGFTCTRTSYDYRDLALTAIEGLTSGTSACSGAGLRTLTNTYDGLGRLTESKVSAGQGAGDIPASSTFDAAGNTLSSASVVGGVASSSSYTLNHHRPACPRAALRRLGQPDQLRCRGQRHRRLLLGDRRR